jgi:hypothetical protein
MGNNLTSQLDPSMVIQVEDNLPPPAPRLHFPFFLFVDPNQPGMKYQIGFLRHMFVDPTPYNPHRVDHVLVATKKKIPP